MDKWNGIYNRQDCKIEHNMKHLYIIMLMLLGASAFGQNRVRVGGVVSTDTAWTSSMRIDSIVRLLSYATGDTNKVLGIDAAGRIVLRTKGNGGGGGEVTTAQLADTAAAIRAYIEAAFEHKKYTERWLSQIQGIPTDGATSVAAYVQPVLDSASYFGGLLLHWDIPRTAIDSELRIKSRTTIEGVGMPYVKLLNNVRQPMFINYNAHATIQADSNISISGLFLDGNAFGNIDSVQGYVTRDDNIIVGICMVSVKNVRLDNITFYQTNAWGVYFGNVDYSYVSNLRGIRDYSQVALVDVPAANWKIGKVPLSMDLINYRGGCEYGYWENLRSNSPDDVVAINNIPYSASLGGLEYMNFDPIHDIYGTGLFLDSAALGIAIYSSVNEVYNIGASNIYGTVQHRYAYAGSNSNAAGVIDGYQKGNTRNISIDGVNVQKIAPLPNTFDYEANNWVEMFLIDGDIGSLALSNVLLNKWDRYNCAFKVRDGFKINNLTVTNYVETHDKDTTLVVPRFVIDGQIKHLSFNGVQFSRQYNLPQAGKFLQVDSANSVMLNNVITYNTDTLTRVNAGVKVASFANILMDSCGGALVDIHGIGNTVAVTQSNVRTGSIPYVVGSGAGTAVVNTDVFGKMTFKSNANNTTGESRMFVSNNGYFFAPPTSAGAERYFGVTNNAGDTVQGALSFYTTSGILRSLALTASTGAANTANAQIILEKPGSLANVMKIRQDNAAVFTGTSLQSNADSLYHFKNTNGIVRVWAHNPNSGASAQSDFNAVSNGGSSTFGHYSTGHSTYKTIGANSGFFYNSNGTFDILNDGTNITFASNALTAAQLTLDATGLNLGASTKLKLYNNSAPTNGQLLIGHTANGTFEKATLTAGTGISITDGAGSITIAATGGGGGSAYTVVNVNTTPYTVTPTSGEYIYLVDATSGAITVNLPTAVGNTAKYHIKKVDSSANTVTIDGNGSQTIDGVTSEVINFQYTSNTIISNNANWFNL